MLWNVGLKRRDQQMKEIWLAREGDLLTLMQNTYLKLERNLLDTMQTSEVFGEKEKMNWIVAQQKSRYARGLRSFILERVTAIHAIEFSIYDKDYGFAGTADALIDIDGKLTICDWKTSKEVRSDEMLINYCHQLGAYNYALRKLTGIECNQALVCIARRSGKPQLKLLDSLALRSSEISFMERCMKFQEQIKELAVV
jgi:ATP-dependent exoDNAse (exonuclease V) beta subunit